MNKGPNYVALGKVTDNEGNTFVAATKNGNITESGKLKAGRQDQTPKIHVIGGTRIKRIHSNRNIDLEQVCSNHRELGSHLERSNGRDGVATEAVNIPAQLREIEASL
jgi:hypothetical protein